MRDNPRVINTLVIIAKHVFDEELRLGSLKSTTSLGAANSAFRAIFTLILENQSQNHNFNKDVIRVMIHKMRNMCNMTRDVEHENFAKLEQQDLKAIMIEVMNTVYEKTRTGDMTDVFHGISGREAKNLSLQILTLLSYVYDRLVEKAKERLGINDDDKDGLENELKN